MFPDPQNNVSYTFLIREIKALLMTKISAYSTGCNNLVDPPLISDKRSTSNWW